MDLRASAPEGLPCLVGRALGGAREGVPYAVSAVIVSLGYTGMAVAAAQLAGGLSAHAPLTRLSGWGIFGVVCAGARAVAVVFVARWEARLAGRVGLLLRTRVTRSLLQQGAPDEASLGAVTLALRGVERAAVVGVLALVRSALLLAPLVVALLLLLPLAGALWVVALVPFGALLSRARAKVRSTERASLDRGGKLDAHLDDLLRHIDLFRVHGTRERVVEEMRRLASESSDAAASAAGTRARASSLNEVLAAAAVAAFALAVSGGALQVDARVAAPAIAIAFLLYRPLRDLGDARGALAGGQVALERLSVLLVLPVVAPPPPAGVWRPEGDVVLRAFGAARGGPRWILRAPVGSITAVVGPVGSGKTTLLRALLGLEATVGEGSVAGASFVEQDVDARPFAWVPQDAPVVAGDLRHNLALGGPLVDEAERLLKDLAPSVGQSLSRKHPLSGGERALLAIARAVASGRPVLLLDEPTAHLDAASEARVLALLSVLRGRRTLLLVTHRAEAVALADAVVFVPD